MYVGCLHAYEAIRVTRKIKHTCLLLRFVSISCIPFTAALFYKKLTVNVDQVFRECSTVVFALLGRSINLGIVTAAKIAEITMIIIRSMKIKPLLLFFIKNRLICDCLCSH